MKSTINDLDTFTFLFIDNEEAHDCGHMTYHMM